MQATMGRASFAGWRSPVLMSRTCRIQRRGITARRETCLERGCTQLYYRPGRFFTYLEKADPPIVEGLVVPFARAKRWGLSGSFPTRTSSNSTRKTCACWEASRNSRAQRWRRNTPTRRFEPGRTTERSRRALTTHRQFAEQVVESSGDCIKTLDLGGRILSINTPGRQLMEIDDFQPARMRPGRNSGKDLPLNPLAMRSRRPRREGLDRSRGRAARRRERRSGGMSR